MKLATDVVTSFSPNVKEYAFQINVVQKNTIDIYSLDPSNDYDTKRSLINQVDYEGNDLKASEVSFIGWCTSSELNSVGKTKRTRDSESKTSNHENFFVNGFQDGKIVVFSSTGKQIVNIIHDRKDLLYIDTENEFIWILDCELTVKVVSYSQSKPLKSFQLSDLKNLEIKSFNVLPRQGNKVYLTLSTEEILFIIDPSHNEPKTVLQIEKAGCRNCQMLNHQNQEHLVVTTDDRVLVFSLSNGQLIQEWELKVEKLRIFQDFILALDAQGVIRVLKIGSDRSLDSCIEMPYSRVIDFITLKDILLIAWLNVNEPNFKSLPLEEVCKDEKIILNNLQDDDVKEQELNGKVNGQSEAPHDTSKCIKKKICATEQDEIIQSLINILDKNGDSEAILSILSSPNWTEQNIKSFVVYHINNQEKLKLLFELITSNYHKEIWSRESSLAEWLKWFLTLRGEIVNSKHMKKATKGLKSSLKNSADSLPILVGIQGRLELLRKQAQLREDLVNLNVSETDEKVETGNHENISMDGEGENQDESVQFVNGESDTYIDAQEM